MPGCRGCRNFYFRAVRRSKVFKKRENLKATMKETVTALGPNIGLVSKPDAWRHVISGGRARRQANGGAQPGRARQAPGKPSGRAGPDPTL